MAEQSELYKKVQQVDRIHDLVGSDLSRDGLKVILQEQDAAALVVDVRNLPEPLTTELAEALASNGNDEVRITPTGTVPVEQQSAVAVEDTNGNPVDPAAQSTLSSLESKAATENTLSTLEGKAATENTLSTLEGKAATETTLADLAAALGTNGNDELRISSPSPLDVSAATVTVTDDGSLSVSATPLDSALKSNGTDALMVEHDGVIDVSSRDGRNLGDVDVTDLPDNDYAEAWQATLDASATNAYHLAAQGADQLDGRVRASGSYDVAVEWHDSAGNVVKTNSVATGVAGGTWTDLSGLTAITPYAAVKVTDTSAAAQTSSVALHMR